MIYASRNTKVEPTEFGRIDSGILAFIPKNSCSFITFREDEINEIYSGNQRLWVETLNKSCGFPIEIKKGCVLGFFVAEPEHLKFKHKTTMQKKNQKQEAKKFIEKQKDNRVDS